MTLSDSLRNFLDEVMPAIVGTIRPDGSVQMNPIWYERRGDEIWLNAASSRAWGRRLGSGTPVTLLFVDPANQYRWAQIQGEVLEKTGEGGAEHIDRLSKRYFGRMYGQHDPADPRLLVRVRPTRVTGTFREEAAA
jgi:PPOX class probable F420-dependent enzyme